MKHFLFLIVIVFVWASSCDKSSSKYCQDMSLSSFSTTTEAVQLEPVTAKFLTDGGSIVAHVSADRAISPKDFKAQTRNKCPKTDWRSVGGTVQLWVTSSDNKIFKVYTVIKSASN